MMNDCVDEKWEQPKSNQSMNFKERKKIESYILIFEAATFDSID